MPINTHRIFILLLLAACLALPAVMAQSIPAEPDIRPAALAQAVARAICASLTDAPLRAPATLAPVELVSAALEDRRLTLNFNRALLEFTPGSARFEAALTRVHRISADMLHPALADFEINLAIDGVPLPRFLPVEPVLSAPLTSRQLAPALPGSPPRQPLTGRRIALSPGHGYYLNGANYVLQRSFFSGIVEDFVNHDFITLLEALLVADGADVRSTRNLDRAAGLGETGFPRWQEAARYHIKALGADASVWNESGFTPLEQDIRCRPRYANAVNAELLVSIHNNGGGGTGTETLYDTNNGFGPESKRLADVLHAKVIAAIRRDYSPTWADRRVQGFNGSYGENRLATRPAVIMEIAFMDRPTPDNAALRDERFKLLVAAAIRDGIREYLEGPAPTTPSALLASGETNAITLSWIDGATNEAGFVLERKIDTASTWTALATLASNTTTYRDTTAVTSLTYVYRVRSFNTGGNTAGFSNEATAATLTPAVTLVLTSTTPATQTRDWNQTAEFALAVTDPTGAPVLGAALIVHDRLRNTTDTLVSTTADATGRLTYRTTVPASQANGTYALTFQATKPGTTASAVLAREVLVAHTPTVAVGVPTIITQPLAQTVTAGAPVTLVVTPAISGSPPPTPAYQWYFNSAPLAGSTQPALTLPAVTAAQAGTYAVVVSTSAGSATSTAAALTVHPATWLSNVSLRTTLAAGQNVIVGFVVGGNGSPKDLLVRAAGPALGGFGLTTAMPDPRLALYRGSTQLTENNDWPSALSSTFTALGAFPFTAASRDAALQQSLVGPHTVQVSGATGGVVLVEGYDAGAGSGARLINLSARNRVGTGADILIAGFFVAGTGTQRVLIRAVGPTLSALGVTGVLADPQLEVTDSSSARLAANDNWDAALAPVFAQVGAFPLPAGSRDAAVVVTLTAGRSYTVQVSGVASAIGEALVEVYELP